MRYYLAIFLLISCTVNAQSRFEIGVEGGLQSERYRMTDPGNQLKNRSMSAGAGITFRRNGFNNLFYEASLAAKESGVGINFKEISYGSSTNADEIMMLSLRSGYYIRLSKKFSVAPVAGLGVSYQIFSGEPGGNGTITPGNSLYYYEFTYKDHEGEFNALLLGGISFELLVAKKFKLAFHPHYSYGLRKMNSTEVTYVITDPSGTTMYKAKMEGYGSYMAYNLGIRYLLNGSPGKK